MDDIESSVLAFFESGLARTIRCLDGQKAEANKAMDKERRSRLHAAFKG
jgi:hypothetical protein